MADFTTWWAEREGYLAKIIDLLNGQLSEDADDLWREVVAVERYLGYCYVLMARADGYLDEAEYGELQRLVRLHGQKGLAAYEKEVAIKATVAPVREVRDTLRGVIDTIQRRVSLAQSRLAYLKQLPKV